MTTDDTGSGAPQDAGTGTRAQASPWRESGVADQTYAPGLYVVATPLGNAADMTLRALWVLEHADLIACEDTRTSAPLLARYGLSGRPLFALHQHNEQRAGDRVLESLARQQRVALITDAGTPAISDPGAGVVRRALDAGYRVTPVPGASSLTAALSVAGIEHAHVRFAGFAPSRGSERQRHWASLARESAAVVVFEAPHRVVSMAQEWGGIFPPDRGVVVARELTKRFESVHRCRIDALPQWLEAHGARGEFVFVIEPVAEPAAAERSTDAIDDISLRWLELLRDELPASRLAAVAARATGLPRGKIYDRLLAQARQPKAPAD